MAAISIRIDDDTKEQFDAFCDSVGLSVSAAFNLFAKTVVRERRIPFEIRESTPKYGSMTPEGKKALEAMKNMSRIAQERGIADMTLEEINAEIDAYRRGE